MHLSMNPLKQGLKLYMFHFSTPTMPAFIHESIKTRVETATTTPPQRRALPHLSMNPLKQGLKPQDDLDSPQRKMHLSMNPLKQGLKHAICIQDITNKTAFIHESIKTRVETRLNPGRMCYGNNRIYP